MANDFTGNELALIKAIAVMKQQLYLGNDDIVAEIIYPAIQLLLHDPENRHNSSFFIIGKVERFVGCIGKESVLIDLFSDGVTKKEIRMYQQGVFRTYSSFAFCGSYYLSWRSEKQTSFIEIII